MANTGYSNSNYLDLGYEVNIHGGTNLLADDRTKAVKLSEIYNDIKNYVEANIDLQLQVVNVPTTQTKPRLSVLSDKRTFKLDVPESAISVDDVAVNITSDQIKEPDPTGLGITNQKGYNEYSLERITWLVKWTERADDAAVYSAVPSDPVDNALTAVLNNWNVTAQLPHSNIGVKEQAINKLDGIYLMDLIEDVDVKINNTQSFIYALYQANQFNRYCIKVDDGTGTIPNPGELVYQQETYKNQEKILINELSYSNTYLLVEYDDDTDPDIPNAYGVFNNKENVVININGRIYHVGDDQANPDDTITRIVDGDNAYYEFVVYGNVEDEDAVDSGNETQSVGVYKTSPEVDALLQDYMKKDGKLADGTDDHFRGEIDFRAGLHLSEENSYIKLKFDKGQEGDVLTSMGDATPVWTNIEEIYVKKSGDTMTGDLKFENSGIITEVTSTASQDNQVWDSTVDRFNVIKTNAPKIILDDVVDENDRVKPDFSSEWGIKFDIDAGNSGKNRVKVSNRYGDIVQVAGGTGPQINFGKPEDSNGDPAHPNANGDAWKSSFFEGDEAGVKILGIPTPSADAPDDIAVNKGYVDNAVGSASVVDGGCIELNGGYLCGGRPHPTFMETLKSGNITFDEFPKVNDSNDFIINGVDERNGIVYRTKRNINSTNQEIYSTNYKTGVNTRLGYLQNSDFAGNYGTYVTITTGSLSHDKKYTVLGIYYYNFNTNSKTQYVYEHYKSNGYDTNRSIRVISGRQGRMECTGLVSTKAKFDSPSGYMIGSFEHVGYNSNYDLVYDNSIVIRKYGDTSNVRQINTTVPNTGFGTTRVPYVFAGNTEHDEFFVGIDGSAPSKWPLKKVKFGNGYNYTTLEDFLPSSADIRSVTYLPNSKRYYLSSYDKGYLTVPYDGPLDDKCLTGAITVEFEDYPEPQIYEDVDPSTFKRFDAKIRAFEFGGEIVVPSSRLQKTIYEPGTDRQKKVIIQSPQSFAIFKGGTEFDYYHSTAKYTDQDGKVTIDDEWSGNDFTWDQAVPDYHFKYYYQRPSQVIDDNRVILPINYYDTNLNTPGVTLPYHQELYWNGVAVKLAE